MAIKRSELTKYNIDWLSVQGEGIRGYSIKVVALLGWANTPKNILTVYKVMSGQMKDRQVLDAIMAVVLEPEACGPAVVKTELKGKLNLTHS